MLLYVLEHILMISTSLENNMARKILLAKNFVVLELGHFHV